MSKQSKLNVGLKNETEDDLKDELELDDEGKIKLKKTILNENEIYTVKGITLHIKQILENHKNLIDIWIRGEISNLTKHTSGILYFTLKDDEASLPGIMFRDSAKKLRFDIEYGMKILAHGHISVYMPQGKYQIVVDEFRPDGLGALHLAYLQLKDKLSKEGLFDDIHKKPLPRFPKVIGIATSISGAALRDIINIISRRFPAVTIYCVPTQVQGDGAAESIQNSIRILDNRPEVDLIIVGRGGGSLEDLWAFNEEMVVRTIFKADKPIVSAVGHQTDFTLSDFAADIRAPTPSAAAEIVVPESAEIFSEIESLEEALKKGIINILNRKILEYKTLTESYAFQRPYDNIYQYQQKLDELIDHMVLALKNSMRINKLGFQKVSGKLETLNPGSVLKRGYSVALTAGKEGKVISSIVDLESENNIDVITADGEIKCNIESMHRLDEPIRRLTKRIKKRRGKLIDSS